ncbi:MAG: hypothetical protein LBT07_02180 [Endomicrobium sp.]|jgi:starch synthase|nr:hypothetical protein [Endomicrobium sp.]
MPKTAVLFSEYNENPTHKIYASSDGYIMSSRFEPCGLSQIIALAYGTNSDSKSYRKTFRYDSLL